MKQHIMSVKHGIDRYEIRELPTGYVIHANSTGEIKYSEIKAVSYTHLDVYKRQSMDWLLYAEV